MDAEEAFATRVLGRLHKVDEAEVVVGDDFVGRLVQTHHRKFELQHFKVVEDVAKAERKKKMSSSFFSLCVSEYEKKSLLSCHVTHVLSKGQLLHIYLLRIKGQLYGHANHFVLDDLGKVDCGLLPIIDPESGRLDHLADGFNQTKVFILNSGKGLDEFFRKAK